MLRKINLPALRYAFKASLPVMAGYLVLGAGFGILLQAPRRSLLVASLIGSVCYGLYWMLVQLGAANGQLILRIQRGRGLFFVHLSLPIV